MDLSSPKVSNADKLSLCKKYFFLGFAFLPFLWAVNAVWFFSEAFRKTPTYAEQSLMKKLVIASALGSCIWTGGLVAWIGIFTSNRASWGAFADEISYNIPIGQP